MQNQNTWICPSCKERKAFDLIPVYDTLGRDTSDTSILSNILLECKGCGYVEAAKKPASASPQGNAE